MIDIENDWAPQMLRYCELISDPQRLHSAFNQQPGEIWTSVTDYSELMCQIFDDLAAKETFEQLKESNLPRPMKESLERFVDELDSFNQTIGDSDPDFRSTNWATVTNAARAVVAASQVWNTH